MIFRQQIALNYCVTGILSLCDRDTESGEALSQVAQASVAQRQYKEFIPMQ